MRKNIRYLMPEIVKESYPIKDLDSDAHPLMERRAAGSEWT